MSVDPIWSVPAFQELIPQCLFASLRFAMTDRASQAVGDANGSNFDTFTKLVHALNEANAEATQLERQIEAKTEEQRLLSAEVQRLKRSSSWLFSWGTPPAG